VNFSAPIDRTLNPGTPPGSNATSYSPLTQSYLSTDGKNATNPPKVPTTKTGFPLPMVSALAFTILALLALFYSLGLYLWRVDRISKRVSVNYHDWFGPSALCLGLFGAVLVSFGFRMWGWGEGVEFKG
jgi:hypothetical protein